MVQQYLLASDFDQTLSFNDSGVVLAELVGMHGFHDKVRGLAQINLVQQGAELSYLILHDPEFRRIRREHLVEAGKLIRLKHDVKLFAKTLETLADGYKFNSTSFPPRRRKLFSRRWKASCRRKIFTAQSFITSEQWRSESDCPRIGRLGQSHRARRDSRATWYQSRPHRVHGRRQLRPPGDDACQSA